MHKKSKLSISGIVLEDLCYIMAFTQNTSLDHQKVGLFPINSLSSCSFPKGLICDERIVLPMGIINLTYFLRVFQ